ncbi:endonuclease/exonuclease/phosphatase family protein [Streptosporangium sp. NPDC020072]|uniref:endonuclease/exonuclease/phosphatase family protein n=1 Tax=Streptosporangium sp. NPDC020072 TaxID=3154788 RepID=UPI00341E3836
MTNTLRVATYNLGSAKHDGGAHERVLPQLELLAGLGADVVAVQAAKNFHEDGLRMVYEAERILGMRAVLVESAHDDCHLLTLVRTDRVRIINEHNEQGDPFWHAAAGLHCEIDGKLVLIGHTHLAPFSHLKRAMEAPTLKAILKGSENVIMMGDWNSAPDNHPALEGLADGKDDVTPDREMRALGLHDVGAVWGDHTPTVHWDSPKGHRANRIYTSLLPKENPRMGVIAYRVVTDQHTAAPQDAPSTSRPVVVDLSMEYAV